MAPDPSKDGTAPLEPGAIRGKSAFRLCGVDGMLGGYPMVAQRGRRLRFAPGGSTPDSLFVPDALVVRLSNLAVNGGGKIRSERSRFGAAVIVVETGEN